jgi:tRNA/rRNA methyltransferase/tRNA (cytidine32/uridine32-2'-O)-methyltransferase
MPSRLDAVRVVLLEPQDPVNIAATVRAMANMGVSSLHLVRPCPYDPYRLEGIAHGTRALIDAIVVHDTLDAALADCVAVAAFVGKPRAAKWPHAAPRAAAEALLAASEDGPVALLFGREDWGLPKEAIDRATLAVTIPTTEHSSLNLAQAVLVGLYELHVAAGDATRRLRGPRKGAGPASMLEYERYFDDAEGGLAAIDFFKTRNPEHVMRTVRSITFRAQPDAREITLLRAMAIEVQRVIARLTGQPTPAGSRRTAVPTDASGVAAAGDASGPGLASLD